MSATRIERTSDPLGSVLPRRQPMAPAALRLAAPAVCLALAAATGGLTLASPQLALTVVMVSAVVAAWFAQPRIALLVLWAVWLLAPALRRVLGLVDGYNEPDPLAVAPYLATAAVIALLVIRNVPTGRLRTLLLIGFGALALGVPAAADEPTALIFGALAYGTPLAAAIIGHAEGRRPLHDLSLAKALTVGAPLLAVYGLYQYFAATPLSWDALWLDTVTFTSIGAPEEGKIRIFSTVNSPGLFGVLLVVAMLLLLGRRRLTLWTTPLLGLLVLALALTYVRSAWIGLAIGTVAFALTAGRQALPRLAVAAVVVVAGLAALQSGGSTATAFDERFGSLSSLGSDRSANERIARPTELLPDLVTKPFGNGLGSAGEATRLRGDASGLAAPDNGYLSAVFQLGPVGGLLLVGVFLWAIAIGIRAGLTAKRRPRAERAGLIALMVAFAVMLVAGDQFYGLAGVVLWYLAGVGLRLDAERRGAPNRPVSVVSAA